MDGPAHELHELAAQAVELDLLPQSRADVVDGALRVIAR
jgi:hypothetical protein